MHVQSIVDCFCRLLTKRSHLSAGWLVNDAAQQVNDWSWRRPSLKRTASHGGMRASRAQAASLSLRRALAGWLTPWVFFDYCR